MRVEQLTPPQREPITLEALKDHLRVDESEDDAYLGSLIESARQTVEVAYGIAMITREVAVFLDAWPRETKYHWWDGSKDGSLGDLVAPKHRIALPVRPVGTLLAIEVFQNGTWSSLDLAGSYIQPGLNPQLYPASTVRQARPDIPTDGIRIRLEAGFGADWNAVPPAIQMAVMRLAAHLYAHRGDAPVAAMTSSGARQLMAPYRQVQL